MNLEPASEQDIAIVRHQLTRTPRGIAGIASRCVCGAPLVVITKPRLDDGTPFPTTFYLTHPYITACVSRLEAAGLMKQLSAEIENDPELGKQYRDAHDAYIATRKEIGKQCHVSDVPEIDNFSAGGMPVRVKCLHALVGHSLAVGPGINPIGDRTLELIKDHWDKNKCFCEKVEEND
ncbi:MAG: DUF501 domain-containing protein [Micrococcaceae bacterium]